MMMMMMMMMMTTTTFSAKFFSPTLVIPLWCFLLQVAITTISPNAVASPRLTIVLSRHASQP
jgi:hypothetical protein